MIHRVLSAYSIELSKAVRTKFTYAGPLLVVLAVLFALLDHPVRRDSVADYAFIAYATPLALNLLGLLLLLIFCAGLISGEMASGTIRQTLVRPIRRHECYLAKSLLCGTYAALLLVLVTLMTWGIAFTSGDLAGVTVGGELLYSDGRMRSDFLLGALLALLPMCAAGAYALFVSVCTRSPLAAAGASVGIWLLVDFVKYRIQVAPYLFTTYLDAPWQVFIDHCDGIERAWASTAVYTVATSLPAIVMFTGLGMFVLERRNFSG